MESLPRLSNEDLGEIKRFEADILARCGKPGAKPLALPEDLESRRFQLLTRHLGFQPRQPLPLVHVLGDSHAGFFSGSEGLNFYQGRRLISGLFRVRYVSAFVELLPVFRVYHVGASTAWNADFYGASTRAREKIELLLRRDIPRGSRLLLGFGEIDCRWHIPKAVLGGKKLEAAVAETVRRFMRLPLRLREAGYEVTVWQTSTVMVADATPPDSDHPFPTSGSQQLRLEITHRYCEQLTAACRRENLRCTGIAGLYHSWDTTAPPECFLDNCHLSQRMMPLALHTLISSGALPLERA